jgi:hypothetical protein
MWLVGKIMESKISGEPMPPMTTIAVAIVKAPIEHWPWSR